MPLITYEDKVDYVTNPLPAHQKAQASDFNQLKEAINNMYAALQANNGVINKALTSSNFTGGYYDDSDLVGLTPQVDFQLFTNDGSGTLLSPSSGYTFDGAQGRITTEAGNYVLKIFKPIM
jgi:hypothetical protein